MNVSVVAQRVEESPEFRELRARRRRFIVPALTFAALWYFGFIILSGYAEDFMAESVYEGLTVGYVFAFSQFVMVWTLSIMYLRYADRVLDPLRERAAARAREIMGGQS